MFEREITKKHFSMRICPGCNNKGFYFTDNIEGDHYVICNRCGQKFLDAWCSDCAVGLSLDISGGNQPRVWTCSQCNREYSLPQDLYESPTILYSKNELPKGFLKEFQTKDSPRVKRKFNRTSIPLRISLFLVGVFFIIFSILYLNSKTGFQKYLSGYLLINVFFISLAVVPAIFICIIKVTRSYLYKMLPFLLIWISLTVLIANYEYSTIYDWASKPQAVNGFVEYVKNHRYMEKGQPHYETVVKLKNSPLEWELPPNKGEYNYLESYQDKKVVIEYTPKLKKVLSVKLQN